MIMTVLDKFPDTEDYCPECQQLEHSADCKSLSPTFRSLQSKLAEYETVMSHLVECGEGIEKKNIALRDLLERTLPTLDDACLYELSAEIREVLDVPNVELRG
jgi:ribosomal protein RSM22 (predicted rRNA methylase)